jgi:hypothetical protein
MLPDAESDLRGLLRALQQGGAAFVDDRYWAALAAAGGSGGRVNPSSGGRGGGSREDAEMRYFLRWQLNINDMGVEEAAEHLLAAHADANAPRLLSSHSAAEVAAHALLVFSWQEAGRLPGSSIAKRVREGGLLIVLEPGCHAPPGAIPAPNGGDYVVARASHGGGFYIDIGGLLPPVLPPSEVPYLGAVYLRMLADDAKDNSGGNRRGNGAGAVAEVARAARRLGALLGALVRPPPAAPELRCAVRGGQRGVAVLRLMAEQWSNYTEKERELLRPLLSNMQVRGLM